MTRSLQLPQPNKRHLTAKNNHPVVDIPVRGRHEGDDISVWMNAESGIGLARNESSEKQESGADIALD